MHYHTDTPWKVLEYAAALSEVNTIIVETWSANQRVARVGIMEARCQNGKFIICAVDYGRNGCLFYHNMHAPTQNVRPEPGSRREQFYIRPHGETRRFPGDHRSISSTVQCHYFVVMPNHFHALVEIQRPRADMESAPTVISIVRAFKRYSTISTSALSNADRLYRLINAFGSVLSMTMLSATKPITA